MVRAKRIAALQALQLVPVGSAERQQKTDAALWGAQGDAMRGQNAAGIAAQAEPAIQALRNTGSRDVAQTQAGGNVAVAGVNADADKYGYAAGLKGTEATAAGGVQQAGLRADADRYGSAMGLKGTGITAKGRVDESIIRGTADQKIQQLMNEGGEREARLALLGDLVKPVLNRYGQVIPTDPDLATFARTRQCRPRRK